jgi:hypothetical protein
MSHLETERLAALDHELPSPAELAHLAACAACRAEWQAYAELARLAEREAFGIAEAARTAAPLTSWETLGPALEREGLLVRAAASPTVTPVPDTRRLSPASAGRAAAWRAPIWLRNAAAAVALLVVGMAGGRWSASPVTARGDEPIVLAGAPAFGSLQDASRVLDQAQRDAERAALWIAAHDTTVNAQSAYRARLAALEQMMSASRAGLFEAPEDPILNQYYLAAYTAREATLRQLGASLPVDRVLERF